MKVIRFPEKAWGDVEGLYKQLCEGTLEKGDVLAMHKYDKSDNILPTNKYELVIESYPERREVIVIGQFSNGDISRSNHRVSERGLEMNNLNHYEKGSEEYKFWERKLKDLEIWEKKE